MNPARSLLWTNRCEDDIRVAPCVDIQVCIATMKTSNAFLWQARVAWAWDKDKVKEITVVRDAPGAPLGISGKVQSQVALDYRGFRLPISQPTMILSDLKPTSPLVVQHQESRSFAWWCTAIVLQRTECALHRGMHPVADRLRLAT